MNLLDKLCKRRTYIVDRGLQFGLAARAMAFLVLVFALLSVSLVLPLVKEMHPSADRSANFQDKVTAFLYLHEHFWPIALICCFVTVIVFSTPGMSK